MDPVAERINAGGDLITKAFIIPNVVDASGGSSGVLYWNGTAWVPAG